MKRFVYLFFNFAVLVGLIYALIAMWRYLFNSVLSELNIDIQLSMWHVMILYFFVHPIKIKHIIRLYKNCIKWADET